MIDEVLVLGATVPAVVFPVLYAVRSNWRANRVGRALMQFATAAAIVLVLASLATFFDDYPYREAVRIAAYSFLLVALWRQVYVLLRVQNGERNDDQRERNRAFDKHNG